MSTSKSTKTKATATKRPVGRPPKATAKNVTVTKTKKTTLPTVEQETRQRLKAKVNAIKKKRLTAKGHARPSTTTPLYDAKAAIDDLNRKMLAADAQNLAAIEQLKTTVRRQGNTIDELVKGHNASIKVETRKSCWPFNMRRIG